MIFKQNLKANIQFFIKIYNYSIEFKIYLLYVMNCEMSLNSEQNKMILKIKFEGKLNSILSKIKIFTITGFIIELISKKNVY